MKQFTLTTAVIATILILALAVMLSVYESNRKMAFVVGGLTNQLISADIFSQKLSWLTKPESSSNGYFTPVLECYTNSGKKIKIIIAEGVITKTSIEPKSIWYELLKNKNSLILNSPDESYTCPSGGGINSQICEACKIKPPQTLRKAGSVEILECLGREYTKLGIHYVANAVVVNFKDRYSDDFINKNDFKTFWESNLQLAITNFFEAINEYDFKSGHPNSYIISSIGTGTGKINKKDFYSLFFSSLIKELGKKQSQLSGNLILSIYKDDLKDVSLAPSISDGLVEVYKERRNPNNKKDISIYLNVIGISFSLLVMLTFIFYSKMNSLKRRRDALEQNGLLLTIGLFIISFGFSQSFYNLPDFHLDFIELPYWIKHILVGLLSVPLSIFITNAMEITKPELLEKQHTTSKLSKGT